MRLIYPDMSNCENVQKHLEMKLYRCYYNAMTCLNVIRKEVAMPISEKDKAYMREVAAYFRSTITPEMPEGSIRDTALHFDINRNKVRKILITTGCLVMPLTETVIQMRAEGKSVKEIAAELDVSVATVSTALPYEDKIDNSLEPSEHAADVRMYRAYEQGRRERQAPTKKGIEKPNMTGGEDNMSEKEWQKDTKMSFTESYHRPHRMTWGDMDELRKEHETALKEADPDLLEEFQGIMRESDERKEAERRELEELEVKQALCAEEQVRLTELRHKLGRYPGALSSRDRVVLEEIAGNRLPPEPMGVMRLHLEVEPGYMSQDDLETLRKFGEVKHGETISRDILVPSDLPLYALHYVIQRAFGWQNSHLHQFLLPREQTYAMTDGSLARWSCMVGVLFRSPLMDEDEEFWADDYNGGSFKNWLRKKYTGPYMSQCHGEGFIACQEDMMQMDMESEFYLMYEREYNYQTKQYEEEEFLSKVSHVLDHKGNRREEPKPYKERAPYRIKIVQMADIPAEGIQQIFERDAFALLERLPLFSVIAPGRDQLSDQCEGEEREYVDDSLCESVGEMYQAVGHYIENLIENQIDSPLHQVAPMPVTDTLLYQYDFGDNWQVRITASENCPDLVESGRITQAELDRANVKCRETYRPVLLARDGEMLMDDVGGLGGYAEFLRTINPDLDGMDADQKAAAKQERKEMLTWAKGMGWKKDNATDFNLL